jgi:hypothetical protein
MEEYRPVDPRRRGEIMTLLRRKLLRDLWQVQIPLERRCWRLLTFIKQNELGGDAVRSLLLDVPADLRAYVMKRG